MQSTLLAEHIRDLETALNILERTNLQESSAKNLPKLNLCEALIKNVLESASTSNGVPKVTVPNVGENISV